MMSIIIKKKEFANVGIGRIDFYKWKNQNILSLLKRPLKPFADNIKGKAQKRLTIVALHQRFK